MENIRGFIFDLDGTLVTSSLDFLAIKREIGCPPNEDALTFIESLPDSEQKEAMAVIHFHEMQDAESSEWMPGAQEFIEACFAKKMPMGIVTRNSKRSSQMKIKKNNIPITLLITRECSAPKPDPGALLDIAQQFSMPPRELLMVGDYRYDLEAGRNANMPSCLLHYKQLPDYADLADYAFPTFDELHQAVFSS